jgi:hypothetical protein
VVHPVKRPTLPSMPRRSSASDGCLPRSTNDTAERKVRLLKRVCSGLVRVLDLYVDVVADGVTRNCLRAGLLHDRIGGSFLWHCRQHFREEADTGSSRHPVDCRVTIILATCLVQPHHAMRMYFGRRAQHLAAASQKSMSTCI